MKNFLQSMSRVLGGERILRIVSQSSDVLLAFFVITIIMMIIIPFCLATSEYGIYYNK